MTVIVNCRFLTQDLTGVQRFAEEITKRLPAQGEDVELVAPRGRLRHTELGGVQVRQIGRLRGHAWEQLELARYVRQRDGLLLSLGNTGPIAVKNQLLVIHDLTWLHFPESYSWKFRTLYRFLTTKLVRKVHKLATVSNFSRQDIAQHFNLDEASIGVIGNAVDDRFRTKSGVRPEGAPDGDFFLVVSSLNKHKNVGPFVQAFLQFKRTNKTTTQLVLAGGSSRVFAAQNVTGSAGNDGVNALGRVTDDELIWLYHHAKAFFFPSLYEGFGVPPLEALACGCPVYSSNAASLPEVLGDRAIYFDPTSEKAMLTVVEHASEGDGIRPKVDGSTVHSQIPGWDANAKRIASFMSGGDSEQ